MFRKILLPLDMSEESEKVVDHIRGDLAPDGTLILLHVIPPARTLTVGNEIIDASGLLASERSNALGRLREMMHRKGGDPSRWRCEVAVSESVAKGIVDFAAKEEVDIIAMYTHDRKGLARLIRGSVARNVQRKATIEVKVFTPRELALV